MHLRNGLMAGLIAILGVVAIAGWTRKPTGPLTQQASYDSFAQPVNGTPCVDNGAVAATPVAYTSAPENRFVSDRYVQSIHRPVRILRQEEQPQYQAPLERSYAAQPVYGNADRDNVRYSHGRSTGKSVAIVAGSAAGGAAIGAIAGGGKGAGIGALSGGAAGFVYDRITHNRR